MTGILAAKERDLDPIVDESAADLALDDDQIGEMEGLLDLAWVCGAYIGHANIRAQMIEHAPADLPIPSEAPNPDLEGLARESADTLNLTTLDTMRMWGFLERAVVAGIRAFENEILEQFVVPRVDIAGEALRWLRESEPPR